MNVFSGNAPCPKCSCPYADKADPLFFGALGMALFRPVQCINCGKRFNGKTGRANFLPILFYMAVVSVGGYFLWLWLMPKFATWNRGRRPAAEVPPAAVVRAAEPLSGGNARLL
jgi:hypothetical protein